MAEPTIPAPSLDLVAARVAALEAENAELRARLALAASGGRPPDGSELYAALRESEARFRQIAEAAREVFYVADLDQNRVVYVSPAYREVWGEEPERLYAQRVSFLDPIHPDDRGLMHDAMARQARGHTTHVEYRLLRPDGELRWISDRSAPVFDVAGRPYRVVGAAEDITERKRVEASLSTRQATLRAIANSIDTIIWSTRPDGFHDYYNQRWYDFTGVPKGSTDGEGWSGLFHPDDQPRAWAQWRRSLETGEPYEIEYRLRHGSGQYRWVLGRALPVRDEAGVITRWFGTCTDIQQIVEARETLSRSRESLEAQVAEALADRNRVWRLSPDLLLVSEFDGRIVATNPAWGAVLGWSESDLAGARFFDLLHPEDLARTETETGRLGSGLTTNRFENRYRHKDGTYRWIVWTAAPEAGRIYGVGRDATAEKEAAAELARAEDALRQAQKMEAVGQLTGGVAHDFNNLLQVIVGNLEILRRGLPEDAVRPRRSVENALQGARRAGVLTQRLLAFSRRQPLEPRPIDVNRLVLGMSDLLTRTLGETVAIETVPGAGVWRIEADPNQLENAVLNLAVNARDAMPDGGKLTIETANTYFDEAYAQQVGEVSPGQYVMLSVSDTGAGMDPAVVDRAFEPFFTTKGVGAGTGLGLSQVYGFLRQSSGHVRIYSEVGQGTTVKLYLPRLPGEAPLAPESAREDETPEARRGETVLVVEDDPAVRAYSVEVLRELGHRVLEAEDGPTALALLDRMIDVDLLFTDVVLPGGMTGEQVAHAARALRPQLKVLFTTGYARNALIHHGRLEPGVNLITKPFTYADLAKKIRTVLDGTG